MINELQDLGLTKNEAHVYTICLKKGASSAFNIAESASIPTTTVYNTLKRLAQKGLIATVPRKGKKFYEVNDPKVFQSIKEQELEKAKKIIPTLDDMYMGNINESRVRHYTEIDGIKGLLDEMLEEANEILIIGSVAEEVTYFKKYFPHYIDLRLKNKIPARIITEDSEIARDFLSKDTQELRSMKILPAGEKIHSIMYMWPERLIAISFGEKVSITSIEDKNIYKLMKTNFELLWNN